MQKTIRNMGKKSLLIWLLVGLFVALSSAERSISAVFTQGERAIDSDPLTQGITQVGGVGGSIRGIAVQDGFLYAVVGARLVVFDARIPTQMVQVAQSPIMPAGVQGMHIASGYAYVADGLGGLRIFDIHTAITPTPVGFYQTDGLAQQVKVVEDYAYVAKTAVFNGTTYEGGGLDIINVSDPAAPFLVGNLPLTGDELWIWATVDIVGNIAYFGEVRGYGIGGLRIVDVSNPAAPIQISLFTFPTERGGVYHIVVRDGIAFVTSMYRLYALDITDAASPALVGAYAKLGAGGSVALSGDYAYVTDSAPNGLLVVDVSNPAQLTHVTMLETGPAGSVTAVDHTVYLANFFYQSQISILDVTDPRQPATIGAVTMPSLRDANHLAINGNHLYTSEYFGGGHVTAIANPAAATILNEKDYAFDDAVFVGKYGYWITHTDTDVKLQVFDMTNPRSPQPVSSLSTAVDSVPPLPVELLVNHPYAYMMVADALYVIDISNPTQPLLITTVSTPQNVYWDMAAKGQYLYLTFGGFSTFLQILDMTAPENPLEISVTEILTGQRLTVIGDYAYISKHSEIVIIDVSNPLLPTPVGSYVTGGFISQIEAAGHYLFIIHDQDGYLPGSPFAGGLQIFSVAQDPTTPVEVAFHRPMLYPRDIALDGNMIYTVNGWEGVFAFRFTPPAVATVTAVATATLDSPFDQTSYTFPTGTFSNTVTVTHTTETAVDLSSFRSLAEIDHNFVVTAVYSNTAQSAEVLSGQTYTVTIHYNDAQIAGVIENSLSLYRWDGQAWQVEPGFVLDDLNNTLTATPGQLGQFAILGEAYRQFLPIFLARRLPGGEN